MIDKIRILGLLCEVRPVNQNKMNQELKGGVQAGR